MATQIRSRLLRKKRKTLDEARQDGFEQGVVLIVQALWRVDQDADLIAHVLELGCLDSMAVADAVESTCMDGGTFAVSLRAAIRARG